MRSSGSRAGFQGPAFHTDKNQETGPLVTEPASSHGGWTYTHALSPWPPGAAYSCPHLDGHWMRAAGEPGSCRLPAPSTCEISQQATYSETVYFFVRKRAQDSSGLAELEVVRHQHYQGRRACQEHCVGKAPGHQEGACVCLKYSLRR